MDTLRTTVYKLHELFFPTNNCGQQYREYEFEDTDTVSVTVGLYNVNRSSVDSFMDAELVCSPQFRRR